MHCVEGRTIWWCQTLHLQMILMHNTTYKVHFGPAPPILGWLLRRMKTALKYFFPGHSCGQEYTPGFFKRVTYFIFDAPAGAATAHDPRTIFRGYFKIPHPAEAGTSIANTRCPARLVILGDTIPRCKW